MSIDLNIYDKQELLENLEKWGADNKELLMKILEACGTFIADKYVLLNNEYYGDGSPYYNVATLVDSAFKKGNSFNVFCGGTKSEEGINYVEAHEVADALGFEIDE